MPSPIAHLAMGYAIYHASRTHFTTQNQRLFHLIPRLVIITAGLSMLPDLDAVPGILLGNLKQFHNNISHSLGFALLVALGVGTGIWLIRRTGFIRWFCLTLICYSLHIAMDFFTRGRGVMLFWPLTSQRFEPPLELFHGLRWSQGFPEAFEQLTLATELAFVAIVLCFVHLLPWLLAFVRKRRLANITTNPDSDNQTWGQPTAGSTPDARLWMKRDEVEVSQNQEPFA